jgi:pimeloyl-ACP methyl ester carboxylesterase
MVTRLALTAPVAAVPATEVAPVATPFEPRFGEVELATGVRLHYLEQGNPAGKPIILLHGLCDSWSSFGRVLPGLTAAHRVYALDLRGHGDSGRPAGGYTPRDMAGDVVAFMDALKIERATLVGHSMGSFAVQQTALAAPERVAGMVLIGSATTGRSPATEELEQALASLPDAVPADFVGEFQAGTIHHPVPAEFMARVVEDCSKPPARVWREALAGIIRMERISGLGGKQIPALLIWGERDGVFSRAEQQALVASLPIASLRVYRETGHAPHWERPGEVVRDIERFLRTSPP